MEAGGMWEIDPGLGGMLISIHYPTEYDNEIMGCLSEIAPKLFREKALNIQSGLFVPPEGW
jgi:hypothetical protein